MGDPSLKGGWVQVYRSLYSLQVPGKFELKGHDRVKDLSSLNTHNENQYLPRQRRDVTYVSRLQVGARMSVFSPDSASMFLVVKEMSSNHKHALIYKTTTILSGENCVHIP